MLTCKYCGSERKNKNSLAQHEIRCKNNPNRIRYKQADLKGVNNPHYGKKGGNQYTKAKELGIDPPSMSKSGRENIASQNKTRRVSQETKDKLSKSRKKFLNENPDKVPYLVNHYSKGMSYPERYFKDIFDSLSLKYEQEYRIGLYSLDFAILDSKVDIEIDGEQHYIDNRIVESDIRRNKYLEELGWTIIRIRWSEYQKLSFNERQDYIENLTKILKRDVNSKIETTCFGK